MNARLPEISFEIQNLGSVQNGKFTQKPLTIFCGPNNTGKTWTMYSLYHFYKLLRMYVVDYRGMHDTLLPEAEVLNEVMTDDLPLVFNVSEMPTKEVQFHFVPHQAWEKDLETAGQSDVFLMPAERNGLHLLFRELSTRRTALLHHASRSNIDINDLLRDVINSRYAEPIADYINWLNRLVEIQDSKSSGLHRHAQHLQRNLAGGAYRVDPRSGGIDFRPYQPKGSRKRPRPIGLHISSSAAKSLFGLWFYLEHQAAEGSVLMIDEPELNIHPGNQRRIARLLARLVNSGASVVISTHSDYIVREINSLIMLHQAGGDALMRKYSYQTNEVLDPHMVGAYLFDGQTIDAFNITEEDGIHATTFDDVITHMNSVNNDIFFSTRERRRVQNGY